MLRIILLFSLCFLPLFSFDIDKEIDKIFKLPPQERFIAINKLKQKIKTLKEKEREKIIKKLLMHYHINNAPSESIIKDKE
jgi:asparagine synthetase A